MDGDRSGDEAAEEAGSEALHRDGSSDRGDACTGLSNTGAPGVHSVPEYPWGVSDFTLFEANCMDEDDCGLNVGPDEGVAEGLRECAPASYEEDA
eukprot:5628278-Heterocapsa_arctica.AAC.1